MQPKGPRVGVIGAGTMGVGIAYVFAAAGAAVSVVETDARRVAALREVVSSQAASGVERGKLTPAEAESVPTRMRTLPDLDLLPQGLDLLVESVPEQLALKREVLARAETANPRLLASNTSSLSIDDLAAGLARPGDFLGMHFFNPVWSLRLVELIRGSATSSETLQHAVGLVGLVGKEPVVAKDLPGFATSRLDLVAALEAMRMLEDGVATSEDIDRAAVLAYRHPVGPLRLSDIVGLDVRLHIAEHLESVYGERFAVPPILRAKVAAGELGQKSGRGFYDWPA